MTDFVRGKSHRSFANFTRPNDTNAYTAGDVVCDSTSAPTVMQFPRASLDNGESSVIQAATLVDSANQATKPDLELWLFDTAPAAVNDNAAFAPSDAEVRALVGVIAFPSSAFKSGNATSGAGGNAICFVQNIGLPIVTANDTNALYGVLVVRNTYTPVGQERFDIRLSALD